MPRFYKSPTWKHLLTKRDSLVVTDLSRLASNRRARFELGGPSSLEAFVPSDDFRVYFPWDDNFTRSDFDPFYYPASVDLPRVSEGVRFMYSFRREAPTPTTPWVIRHAGPVLELEDDADPSRRLSRFVALDPWAYLYQRPLRLATASPTVNPMPGEQGVLFPAGTPGSEIALEFLRRTIEEDGLTYIDAGTAWGGTADYAGTLETTEPFIDPLHFPRGMSVGQAWEQLVETGTLDIVLTPIWDPFNRPGYCAELNIYKTVGGDPGAVFFEGYPTFNWDRVGRSLTRINRRQDGRERANRIRAYAGGAGGASAPWTGQITGPDAEASTSDALSATRFGESWLEATYVRQTSSETVGSLAKDDLIRRRAGLRTWRLSPTPEFSPRPFQDYMPGSPIAFYHSAKLREEQWWQPNQLNDQTVYPRIFGFTLEISDDSLETVTELDISVDDPPESVIV